MRVIRVDTMAEQGVFEGWGTSLAWWADAVGRMPRVERESVVRRLFGFAEGGLGLSIARFNAGGGENPGRDSTLEPRMAMEGYRPAPDAEIDPHADPGQRAVLRDAARVLAEEGRGELAVEVFGNSPPWWATRSGSVTGACEPGRGGSAMVGVAAPGGSAKRPAPNLAPDRARDYLRYLGDVADFIERDANVRVSSLSPFNEPTSRWWVLGGRQEGCHFTPEGISELLGELAEMPEVTRGRLVSASEEWSLAQAIATWDSLSLAARGVTGRLNAHTYDGESRAAVRARAARAQIPLWVSEYGEGGEAGLELAVGIVRDLRELAPSAWVLWQAVSPDAWGLLRLGAGGSGGPSGRDEHFAAAVTPTPKLDVFARFTRSIQGGMRLVASDDVLSVAAIGKGRLGAVIVAEQPASRVARDGAASPAESAAPSAPTAPAPPPASAEQVVRLELPPGSALGTAEVVIAMTLPDAGQPVALRVEPEGGAIEFALPAGGVASVVAEFAPPAVPRGGAAGLDRPERSARFGVSGTWWLEHESGSRLGLSAMGEGELRPGVAAIGVAPDDSSLAQRWRAEACGDGSARWVCEASGCQLDVRRGSRRPGASVIQWHAGLAERTPANSRFHIAESRGGFVQLIARHSGCALALDARGRAVQRRRGSEGTRWRLVRAAGRLGEVPLGEADLRVRAT